MAMGQHQSLHTLASACYMAVSVGSLIVAYAVKDVIISVVEQTLIALGVVFLTCGVVLGFTFLTSFSFEHVTYVYTFIAMCGTLLLTFASSILAWAAQRFISNMVEQLLFCVGVQISGLVLIALMRLVKRGALWLYGAWRNRLVAAQILRTKIAKHELAAYQLGTDMSMIHVAPSVVDSADPDKALRNHGRALGRVVGSQIRREMGYPKYTTANKVVAAQRIESYRRDHCTTLRLAHQESFVRFALYYVFTPSLSEVKMNEDLHTIEDQDLRLSVLSRTAYPYPFLPQFLQRWLGLGVRIAPDFQ